MAKAANSTAVPELNRRNVVVTGAALLLAGGGAAAAAATPTAGDEALFAAIEIWQSGRASLAELDAKVVATHDELKACKINFPRELLEPLDMPARSRRPWPNPHEPGWSNETLWNYIDCGSVPDPEYVRGEDGVWRSPRELPISQATIGGMKELRAMRKVYSEAVATAEVKHDDAQSRFNDMADLQFARMMAVATTPARTSAGAKAKCAVLLGEPMAGAKEETDDGAIIRSLIADLQALAA